MKKTVAVIGLVFGLSGMTMAATVLPAQHDQTYQVTIKKQGKVVFRESLSVMTGIPTSFHETRTIPYVAKSTMKNGVVTLTPQEINVGVSGMLAESAKLPNVVTITAQYSRLLTMKKMAISGQSIELPKVATVSFRATVKPGKDHPVVLTEQNNKSIGDVTVSIRKV